MVCPHWFTTGTRMWEGTRRGCDGCGFSIPLPSTRSPGKNYTALQGLHAHDPLRHHAALRHNLFGKDVLQFRRRRAVFFVVVFFFCGDLAMKAIPSGAFVFVDDDFGEAYGRVVDGALGVAPHDDVAFLLPGLRALR